MNVNPTSCSSLPLTHSSSSLFSCICRSPFERFLLPHTQTASVLPRGSALVYPEPPPSLHLLPLQLLQVFLCLLTPPVLGHLFSPAPACSSGLLWAPLCSSVLLWAPLGSSGLLWAPLCSSRLLWAPLGSSVLLWALALGSSWAGLLWAPLGSSVLLCAPLCSSGLLWAPLGSSVLLWAPLCSSVLLWAPLGSSGLLLHALPCCSSDLSLCCIVGKNTIVRFENSRGNVLTCSLLPFGLPQHIVVLQCVLNVVALVCVDIYCIGHFSLCYSNTVSLDLSQFAAARCLKN